MLIQTCLIRLASFLIYELRSFSFCRLSNLPIENDSAFSFFSLSVLAEFTVLCWRLVKWIYISMHETETHQQKLSFHRVVVTWKHFIKMKEIKAKILIVAPHYLNAAFSIIQFLKELKISVRMRWSPCFYETRNTRT